MIVTASGFVRLIEVADVRLWRVERRGNEAPTAESADSYRRAKPLAEVPHRRNDWVVFNDRGERWSGVIEVGGGPP